METEVDRGSWRTDFAILESPVFREMVHVLNPNTNIPSVWYQEEFVSSEVVTPRTQTSRTPTSQILVCTKLANMMSPSDSVPRKVVVDVTPLPQEFSPTKISV